jgi:cobalamin biosynthesis Mg chelatase CobN
MNAVAGRESVSSQPTDTDTDSSGGRDGTYPPGWFDETDETEDTVQQSGSYTSTTNETVRDGGVGTDVSQPVESVKEPEPSEDYVEGAEMEVEKSEKFNTGFSFSGAPLLGMILVIVLMVIIYWGYRRRR